MQRINRLTRTQLLTLMRSVGLHRGMLSGDYRKYHSNVYYKTMDSLSDPVDYFRKALLIELEHGKLNSSTNVTNDSLRATAKIVAAHLFGVEYDERPTKWKFRSFYYDVLIGNGL